MKKLVVLLNACVLLQGILTGMEEGISKKSEPENRQTQQNQSQPSQNRDEIKTGKMEEPVSGEGEISSTPSPTLDTNSLMKSEYESNLQMQKKLVDLELIETILNNKNFPSHLKEMVDLLKNIKENRHYLPLAILLQGNLVLANRY